MKTVVSRFIIIAVLVLSSISICLSNDSGCDDQPGYSTCQNSESAPQSSSQDQNEDHHCLCSLSCHNLFLDFSTISNKPSSLIVSSTSFIFIQVAYPQVLISLDKPPIV